MIYTVNIVLHLNFEDFIVFNYSAPTIKLFTSYGKKEGKTAWQEELFRNQQPSSKNYQPGKTKPTFSVKGQLFKGLCTRQGKVIFLLLSHHLHHQDETSLPKTSYKQDKLSPRSSQPLGSAKSQSFPPPRHTQR